MKLTAEAGTDAAAVAIFDPAALPEDFDARYKDAPIELIEELQPQGHFFYGETGSDGAYLLHLYVDEPIPEELRPFCVEPIEFESFHIASGSLWFTGAEYAFRTENAFLKKHPGMGAQVKIKPGHYVARFFRTEYPDDYIEEKVQFGMNEDEIKVRRLTGTACFIGFAMTVLIIILLLITQFAWSAWFCLILLTCYWGLYVRFLNLPKVVEARQHANSIEINYPSIVAEFRSLNKF